MNRFIEFQQEIFGKTKERKLSKQPVSSLSRYSHFQSATPAPDWCKLIYNVIRIAEESEGDVWTRPNGGKKYAESDPEMLPVLQQYWEALYSPADAKKKAKGSAANAKADPWSAAFISFVFKEAGFTAAHGFRKSGKHITYIVEAMRNRENNNKTKPFWLYSIGEMLTTAMPVPGDLICFNTETVHSYKGLKKLYFGNNNAPTGASHTDIVMRTWNEGSVFRFETIGGNVDGAGTGTVGLKFFKIEGGNIYRLNETGKNMGEEKNIFAILKLIECPGNRN